jgi:hypothetical protein
VEIRLPFAGAGCSGLTESDFDEYKIPLPPKGCKKGDGNTFVIVFDTPEEALKYAIHLNDVYERMEASSGYQCSREKIKLIISAVNEQVDFKSLNFD